MASLEYIGKLGSITSSQAEGIEDCQAPRQLVGAAILSHLDLV